MAVGHGACDSSRLHVGDVTKGDRVSEVGETVPALGIADLLGTDEARALLEAGAAAGSLNMDEIAAALDELELDAGVLDEFFGALDELQIEIVGRDALAAEYPEATVTAYGDGTQAVFEQQVDVRKPLMRLLALPGRPLFLLNHALMMRGGQRGLRARLRSGLDEE